MEYQQLSPSTHSFKNTLISPFADNISAIHPVLRENATQGIITVSIGSLSEIYCSSSRPTIFSASNFSSHCHFTCPAVQITGGSFFSVFLTNMHDVVSVLVALATFSSFNSLGSGLSLPKWHDEEIRNIVKFRITDTAFKYFIIVPFFSSGSVPPFTPQTKTPETKEHR
jgi:hypothetical protein